MLIEIKKKVTVCSTNPLAVSIGGLEEKPLTEPPDDRGIGGVFETGRGLNRSSGLEIFLTIARRDSGDRPTR